MRCWHQQRTMASAIMMSRLAARRALCTSSSYLRPSTVCVAPLLQALLAHALLALRVAISDWRVACGVWRVACGVWRVACGARVCVVCGVWRRASCVFRVPCSAGGTVEALYPVLPVTWCSTARVCLGAGVWGSAGFALPPDPDRANARFLPRPCAGTGTGTGPRRVQMPQPQRVCCAGNVQWTPDD